MTGGRACASRRRCAARLGERRARTERAADSSAGTVRPAPDKALRQHAENFKALF